MADGAAGFGQGSSDPALLRVRPGSARVPRTGLSPSAARPSRRLPLPSLLPQRPPCNPARASTRTVWAGPLSLAATRGVTLVFLSSAYLDVSVRRVRLRLLADAAPSRGGLPHSGTRGSPAARASPRPFAACRALHRLREPQASPVRPLSLGASRRARVSLVSSLSSLFSLSSHPVKEPPQAARQPHQGRRAPRHRGGCGARTHDPRLAKPAL